MRQNTAPVSFQQTTRPEQTLVMTSGRAGKIVPAAFMPLLNGDSMSGQVAIDCELAEMPRPLLNGVTMNVQAWLVPKCAHPKFPSFEEYMNSREGSTITVLGEDDRDPAPFYDLIDGADLDTVRESDLFRTLGLHVPDPDRINADLIDAYNQIVNFRLAAHSTKLERRPYAMEDLAGSTTLARAFWPQSAMTDVVPDYERSLVVGNLALDVQAGLLPIQGFAANGTSTPTAGIWTDPANWDEGGVPSHRTTLDVTMAAGADGIAELMADMTGAQIPASLADIDKARTTQAFAKLRESYAGNDVTGFGNDETILAFLMQGFAVPDETFKRPILLDSSVASFGFVERFATDAANLDDSVSQGASRATLSLNVPKLPCEAMVVVTVEVVPELIQEAQSDASILANSVSDLPDALRDVQRTEPVDVVKNHRRDARHNAPHSLYGYEPMNAIWRRNFTRLGGAFYQDDASNPFQEQRSAIWMPNIENPEFTEDHWLVGEDFPHDVFADTEAPAFEIVCRHQCSVVGLTQIGDVLSEDNSNFEEVEDA